MEQTVTSDEQKHNNQEKKIAFIKALDKPPFLIGGMIVAIISAVLGWLTTEMATIIVIVGAIGLFLHFKKNKNSSSHT